MEYYVLVTLLVLVNDNCCPFSDAKPTGCSRGTCGEGQFYDNNSDKCMPCSFPCGISQESCRRHDCLGMKQIRSVHTTLLLFRTRFTRDSRHRTLVPHVQVKSGKTTVTEHESVQLECATSGANSGDIQRHQWLGKKIHSARTQIIQDTKTSALNGKFLEFPRIPYDKSGTYTCKAWNVAGMGQGSMDLNVQYSPRTLPGWNMKSDVVGEIGKEASFELFIIANPTPDTNGYVWSKSDIILSNLSEAYEVVSGSTWSKFVIQNVQSYDYANYTCSVQTSGFEAEIFTFRLLKSDAHSVSIIDVSRADDKVTIRWQQVIGRYTAIKIKYCQTGTEFCVDYVVPNPKDTSATLFVDSGKTYYYYYMMIEDGGDVVYTSNRLVAHHSDAKTDTVAVLVGGSVTGTVVLTALVVISAVALCRKRRRSRKKQNNRVPIDTNDDDATRRTLAAIKNSPSHTYANIGTASVSHASSRSARPAKQSPGKPRAIPGDSAPVGDELACSDDDVGFDQYDYCSDTMWQSDASSSRHSPVPVRRTSQLTWRQDVLPQIHVPTHPGSQSDPASTASSYQDMQGGEEIAANEGQREQELEGTYNDVRIVTQGQPGLAGIGLGKARLARELTPGRSNDDEANGEQYQQLEPVDKHEYMDFTGLSQEKLEPQM